MWRWLVCILLVAGATNAAVSFASLLLFLKVMALAAQFAVVVLLGKKT